MSWIRELLRARERRVAAGAVGAALVLVTGGVVGVALLSGGADRSVGIASGLVSNPGAGLSVTVPDGWQELARVERPLPPEVLVVGTAPRPDGEPIEACGASSSVPQTRSGYVTVYEYAPHGPFPSPTRETEYPYPAFQPRPADFSAVYGWGGDCDAFGDPSSTVLEGLPLPVPPVEPIDPTATTVFDAVTSTLPSTTVPAPVNHLREVVFTEGERPFVARIVTVDDPTGDLLAQAYAILNSLRVDLPGVTTTTLYNGPSDEEVARQEIIDAMNAAFGTPSPVLFADSVEGGHPLATEEQKKAAAETAKDADPITRNAYEASQEGAIVVRINWLEWDSPIRATLNFDLLAHGELITATTTGYAVYENDHWRMGRATWCEIAARGGVQCPT